MKVEVVQTEFVSVDQWELLISGAVHWTHGTYNVPDSTSLAILHVVPSVSHANCDFQVSAIEFVLLAIDFVPLANEFVLLGNEFVPFVTEFVALARKFIHNKIGS